MTVAITVLVSTRVDAVSGRHTRSRGDSLAVALALQQAAADRVRVLSAGTMPDEVARDYLALGAAGIELLEADAANVLPLLAAAVSTSPLVLTGTRAEGGLASGALPYALAAALGRPLIADVVDLQAQDAAWIVTQACAKGARRRLRLSVPAVLVVSPAAKNVLQYSHRDRMAGRIVRQRGAMTPSNPSAAAWQLVPAAKRLRVLEARSERSGHARMLGAIDTHSAASGGTVLAAGSAPDKARAILDYLRAHALVNF